MSAEAEHSKRVGSEQGGHRLWPVDWAHIVTLTAAIGLFVVTYISRGGETKGPINWSIANLVLLGILFFIHHKSVGWSIARCSFIRMGYAALTIPLVFTQLGVIIPHVSSSNWEEKLRAFDVWLCGGVEPLTAMEALNTPWLTEILTWIYNYYYFIAIVVGVNVLRQRRPKVLARVTFAFVLCIYLSYVGYYVIPASGPNHLSEYTSEAEEHVGPIAGELYQFENRLEGIWMAQEMRRTIYAVEKIKQDCFPSGHTAVALLALFLAMRYSKRLALVLAPIVLSLIFSTMYLRYHYVADVAAGVVLAIFTYIVGTRLHEAFERRVWSDHGEQGGAH